MFKTDINIYPSNGKTISVRWTLAPTRCMWDLISYIVELNLTISVSGPRKVSTITFNSLKPEARTEPTQQSSVTSRKTGFAV